MATAIQQIIAKVQNHEARMKELEENCGKCDKSLDISDVTQMIEESTKDFVKSGDKMVTDDDVEDKFQKYVQAEHNMTNQLTENQKVFNDKIEDLNNKIAQVLTDLDEVRSENNVLTTKLSTLEAHHNALTIAHNELKDSLNSE